MLGHSPVGAAPLGSSARAAIIGVVLSAVSTAQAVALKQISKLMSAASLASALLSTVANQIVVLGVRIRILDDPRFIRVKSRRN